MKTILLALLLAAPLAAQDLPDAPEPQPKFWSKAQITETIVNVGLGTTDAIQTCQNLARGGHEDWMPTQSCGGNVGLIAGGKLGVIVLDRLLWPNHRKLIPWVNFATMAGTGAALAFSFYHDTSH